MSGVKINTKEDAFRLFDEAVKALINSNFILIQKPITDLLRCLILSDQLRTFVTECCTGVDYEAELANCVSQNETGYTFSLPRSNKKIIAVVTGLLSDFDKGIRHITRFIKDYFPSSDNVSSYKAFCDNVLLQYVRAFRQSFLYNIDSADGSLTPEAQTNVNQTVLDQAAGLLAALRTIFVGDNKLSADRRKDLIALADGLYYSLEKGDCRVIKIVWTGLKIALTNYKKAARKFSEITQLLALYALL